MSYDLFIFAGEASGDLHGEKLLQELPNLNIIGVGGPKMRAQGMKCIMPMEQFQVMGFIDVILALPRLVRQFYAVRRMILEANPKAVVFIDYPGFNLRMAASLRKKGYKGKLCHFICPSVWAWGKKRIGHMANTLDLLLSILPFEKECFAKTNLRVEYVGNPLVKSISVSSLSKWVAIFPGSRKKEILRNFPLQLKVIEQLAKEHPDLQFRVSAAQPKFIPLLKRMSKEKMIFMEQNRELMQNALFAIAKSGTVTLELALHQVPTVVTYGISPLDVFIAKYLFRIRLPFYCLVNIIAGKEVFPELIGPTLTAKNLYYAVKKFLSDPTALESCRQECQKVRLLLGDQDAAKRASELILSLL